jgi:Putative beta-lactamase-inhibitor-like, PepSY-like
MYNNNLIIFLFLLSVELIGVNKYATCQNKSIPQAVTNNFTTMFPDAKSIDWRNKLTDYQVYFLTNNSKCEAKFSLEGTWISTERQIKNDSIPEIIKKNIRSGKYADWNIQSAYVLKFPDQEDQYHIVVTKDDLPNKILFFKKTGELININLPL